MNKLIEYPKTDYPINDVNYMKKLEFQHKKLKDQILQKVANQKEQWSLKNKDSRGKSAKNFDLHPKRFSETDTSFSSPRIHSVSSRASTSNINDDLNESLQSLLYEQNKKKIQKARKQLHKKFTETKKRDDYELDFQIGDGLHGKTLSHHGFSNKCVENKLEKTNKHLQNQSVVTLPSKKIQPKVPARNSARNFLTDSVFEKKCKLFVEKSLNVINEIRFYLEKGVNPPDGDEDIFRRLIRVKEFSNRFSRNYLYPLARQIDELLTINCQNPIMNQKLLSAYQVTYNGLQAYHNHWPASIGTCSSDKLKVLLKHIVEICDIHSRVIKNVEENEFIEFINAFKVNAELTLRKAEDHFSAKASTDSLLRSHLTKLDLPQYGAAVLKNDHAKKARKVPKVKRNPVDTRFSMYTFNGNARLQKAVESYQKKKPLVKSRYKTASFKHRPATERDIDVISQPSKGKLLFSKKMVGGVKRSPLRTPINEDAISTMVQLDELTDDQEKNTQNLPGYDKDIVTKFLRLVLDTDQRKGLGQGRNVAETKGDADGDGRITEIIDKIRAEGNSEVLRKILDGLESGSEKNELQLQIVNNGSETSLDAAEKKRKDPIITISGEKNAKLICIKDENSILETDDDPDVEDKDVETEKDLKIKGISSHTQTNVEINHKSTQKSTKTTEKIKRLPKASRTLQMLPKNYAISVIQYKLNFHKHCKNNPMYTRTTNVVPWLLMGKISDEILNGAFLEVAGEIELNDVLRQIYQSEFEL